MPRFLNPQQEELLEKIVAVGGYDAADQALTEVFQHAIDNYQDLAELRAELQVGLDQRARGEFIEYTAEWRADRLRQVLDQTGQTKATA